ncbi:conserved hypothetical protein [Theileria equi strain WA]|uniref:Uncharacterized protein n=1 Tax=Theileria equi strain WA TaxID=1537102 RepID=L1LDW3_THEEQ|nr:conserved hypothetical protein [Theileria equi strain WA]EKX73469.1 conserved hypothetical protein [Theileria equi strain WA]|eukprot:XP_004832921.1 conserved hypothetical protein [Theileria equi strain WA]
MMKSQRMLIIFYYLLALTILYTKYVSILKNERQPLNSSRIEALVHEPLVTVKETCIIHHQNDEYFEEIAQIIGKMLSENGIKPEFESFSKVPWDTRTEKSQTTKREYSIVLIHGDAERDLNFECTVKGGNTLVFTIYKELSDSVADRIYNLTHRLFFKDLEKGGKDKFVGLNINFILLSSVARWDIKRQILEPFMNKVIDVLSLLYDVNVHGKQVNFDISSFLEDPTEVSALDLQKEGHLFYNFIEGIPNVDVSLDDSHAFRENLNFFALVPEDRFYIHDSVSKNDRSSFMIERLGIFTILNREFKEEATSQDATPEEDSAVETAKNHLVPLTDDEVKELVSAWTTYIRKMFGLPPSLSEYIFSLCEETDLVYGFKVVGKDVEFRLAFESPEHAAFYDFEVGKLLKRFQKIRTVKSIENLQTIESLSKIHFMTQITQIVREYTEDAMNALERVISGDSRSIQLSKFAYKQTLEALGDDEMYYKNILSIEHLFAVLMCDVFPFAFPTLVALIKHLRSR